MYYVYLLSLNNGSTYTGFTNNLKRRLREHQTGQATSTKNKRPLQLIYYEAYISKTDAAARELYLKTGDGRRSMKKQLQHYLNKARSSNG